ncbi:MAG: MoaD/ThiS family protein [Bacteroidia bacterium]
MPRVQFTPILKRFFPTLQSLQIHANSLGTLLDKLEVEQPGIKDYLLDEQGELRQHVNVFVNDELIRDLTSLDEQLKEQDEIFIMQALSGG